MKPMLAVTYEDGSLDPSEYVIMQYKYDGVRALVSLNSDGSFNVVSRTGKPLVGLDGVMKRCTAGLLHLLKAGMTLDGELVMQGSGGKSVDFNELSGLVRHLSADKTDKVNYYVYDVINPKAELSQVFRRTVLLEGDWPFVAAGRYILAGDIQSELEKALAKGYEGIMLRKLDGLYEQGKRSKGLIKVKKFDSDEFPIIGAVEGKGKLAGKLGAFEVTTPEGCKFTVKMAVTDVELAAIWADKDSYMNEMLTVKFQGKSEKGVPRFPIGIAIRNYE